jgi:hypothetical protein
MPLLANEGGCSFGALAGIQEDRQLADKLKDSGQQKPRAPSKPKNFAPFVENGAVPEPIARLSAAPQMITCSVRQRDDSQRFLY